MELKDKLNKPCTDIQRADFIVENNHRNGYEIRETENSIEAWGYTEEEQKERDRVNTLLAERNDLKAYLYDTDWIVVKCMERELDIKTEYPKEYILRGKARTRIDEIDEELA